MTGVNRTCRTRLPQKARYVQLGASGAPLVTNAPAGKRLPRRNGVRMYGREIAQPHAPALSHDSNGPSRYLSLKQTAKLIIPDIVNREIAARFDGQTPILRKVRIAQLFRASTG
jgi:hypothetical protein